MCNCLDECDPPATPFEGQQTSKNCRGQCMPCTPSNATACPEDTDCIIIEDKTEGICVDSGLCTTDKKTVCDEAYAVVTGKSDRSAKCCPATSGCVKTTIGVKATSTCSTNCGSCLGAKTVESKDIPISFCMFGQRLSEFIYLVSNCLTRQPQ